MNIKRIGLIGGNYSPNSGNNTSGDSLWKISSSDRLQHKRNNNAEVCIGTEINVTQTYNGHTDRIAIDVEGGIQIKRDNKPITEISPYVSIGTGLPLNKTVFIGSAVYIETGFDSRNISSGGSGDNLWKVQNNLLIAQDSNRSITLGTSISIGTNAPTEISENGMIVSHDGSNIIYIGSHVHICEETQYQLIIGSGGITLYNDVENQNAITIQEKVNIGNYVTIGNRVSIQDDFNTNRYIDSHNNLKPERIPIDFSLKNSSKLAVNIEPQSNGNIKIGDTLFMPATPSGDPMHYAYETAGAEYNDTNEDIVKNAPWKNYVDTEEEKTVVHKVGHWYINGLGDLTTQEVKVIYNESQFKSFPAERIFMHKKTRTLIDKSTAYPALSKRDYQYNSNTNIIAIAFSYHNADTLNYTFAECSKLKYITPTLNVKWVKSFDNTFTKCYSLISVTLSNVQANISFASSSFISKSSIKYIIDNASPTSAITITLHADAYARLVNDSDIVAALEAKNTALEGTRGSISLVSA